jgi:hypothetical protein
MEPYITKDGKYAVIMVPGGKYVLIGTKSFIENYEKLYVDEVNAMVDKEQQRQQQQQQLSPTAVKFEESLIVAVQPVHDVLLTIEDLKTANRAIPTLKRAQKQLGGLEGLWGQIPPHEKAELWNEIEEHQDALVKAHEYLREKIKGLIKNHGFLLELDYIIDGMSHIFDTGDFPKQ